MKFWFKICKCDVITYYDIKIVDVLPSCDFYNVGDYIKLRNSKKYRIVDVFILLDDSCYSNPHYSYLFENFNEEFKK